MAKIYTGPIEEYPQNFLECRGFMHQWRFVSDLNIRHLPGAGVEFTRQIRCEHCTTRREVVFGADMRRVGRPSYDRPDGYATKGPNSLDVVASRTELIRRAGGR